jgi:hypothetical protein
MRVILMVATRPGISRGVGFGQCMYDSGNDYLRCQITLLCIALFLICTRNTVDKIERVPIRNAKSLISAQTVPSCASSCRAAPSLSA